MTCSNMAFQHQIHCNTKYIATPNALQHQMLHHLCTFITQLPAPSSGSDSFPPSRIPSSTSRSSGVTPEVASCVRALPGGKPTVGLLVCVLMEDAGRVEEGGLSATSS